MKQNALAQAAETNGASGLDVERVRWDFPILNQTVRGKPLAYLDSAATTQKPVQVIRALQEYYEGYNANVHRALHHLAERATEAYEGARRRIAAFIGAPSEKGIVFTRGTTEGINLVRFAWGHKFVGEGDEIVVTEMEHHSNLVPWQLLAAERRAVLRVVPVTDDGHLDLEVFAGLLGPRVRLVAVTHVSNILGTVNPVKRMAEAAHAAGARVLVDGAQSVPHRGIDVTDLGCDFLAFSGHKMCGPTGVGVLYAREELLEAMDPFQGGGEMISRVDLASATWAEIPHKFEAGTPNVAGVIGLGAAVDYLQALGMEAIRAHERELTTYAIGRLSEIPGLRIMGSTQARGGAISFDLEGLHPHDIAQFADREGVAIRAGHMCAQPLIRRYGLTALSRASLYLYSIREEVDQLVGAIWKAKDFFGHGR